VATKLRQADAVALEKACRDPLFFAAHILGEYWWSKQREVASSVAEHRFTSVRSARGVGKTRVAAGIVLWWLSAFPNAKVISTAPTFTGVEKLLWAEVHKVYRQAKVPLGGRLLNVEWKLPNGNLAVGLASDPHNAEAFAGHHEDNLLVVVDEASGVDQRIFDVMRGYFTSEQGRQRMLLIGNPTRTSGAFYRSHTSERDRWSLHHVSAYDSPNFTGEEVPESLAASLPGETWLRDYEGLEGSPIHDVQVLGEFPRGGDRQVCSLEAVEAAQAREWEPATMEDTRLVACDVARFGHDETVIVTRHGLRLRVAKAYVGRDTMETAGWIKHYADELGTSYVVVDDSGVGGGVTDRCRELGLEVRAFNGGEKSPEPERYPNARSAAWFSFADDWLPIIDLDSDQALAAQLVAPEWRMDSAGRRVVEKKDETHKRLGRSPDRADACLLAMVPAKPSKRLELW
jgi:hypothetical protein